MNKGRKIILLSCQVSAGLRGSKLADACRTPQILDAGAPRLRAPSRISSRCREDQASYHPSMLEGLRPHTRPTYRNASSSPGPLLPPVDIRAELSLDLRVMGTLLHDLMSAGGSIILR